MKNKDPYLIFSIVFTAIALLNFIMIGAYPFALIAVMTVIVYVIKHFSKKLYGKNRKMPGSSGYAAFIAAFSVFQLLTPPLTLHTEYFWQYSIQKAYIGEYRNIREPEWFPYFTKDADSFSFDYMPSVMQGTGHYSVTFHTASDDAVKRYENEFSARAVYTIPMNEWYDRYEVDNSGNENSYENILDVYIDDSLRNSETAVIYVIDAVTDFNHPHSSAVIIDSKNNIIQLSQLG